MTRKFNLQQRLKATRSRSLSGWEELGPNDKTGPKIRRNAFLDCGWGRLIFGHTFTNTEDLLHELMREKKGKRDIAFYVRDPHVLTGLAPQEVFLDPSHTYRLWFHKNTDNRSTPKEILVRRASLKKDILAVNKVYLSRGMISLDGDFYKVLTRSRKISLFIASEEKTGKTLGAAMAVDHFAAFRDPEKGSSLWALAVDPQASLPGVGLAIVQHAIDYFKARGRNYLDVSVMHDNQQAICLYEKLGFERVPVFCAKRKNPINEKLFTKPALQKRPLNPYAQIIVDEAKRRGISAKTIDEQTGSSFKLNLGGRSIVCYESLTELTNAIAYKRCENKHVTNQVLKKAKLKVPEQIIANKMKDSLAFLKEHKRVVVKPKCGEQGFGVSVDIRSDKDLQAAIKNLQKINREVLLEEFISGDDLRIVLINFEVVAAAIRKPAEVVGTGQHTIKQLIQKQSRRRSSATGGESKIPFDEETLRCVKQAGYNIDKVLKQGKKITVRKTANLHTGGTIHDVTDKLHPQLKKVAEEAARIINIPVVGLDILTPDLTKNKYVIIEANERPGLANHEPQPLVERFVDFLYPQTKK